MDLRAKLFPIFIVFFLVMIVVEALWSRRRGDGRYTWGDTWASLGSGLGSIIIGGLLRGGTLAIMFGLYYITPLRLPYTWWMWLLCLLAVDFCFYWAHRFGHETRVGWAVHVPHHNSTKYNLSTALRQSWTNNTLAFFYFPLPLLGFPPEVIVVVHTLDSFYQFWIHTEYIGKLPRPIEFLMNTPSHHRVHHGSDAKYLDRNYGGVFIIWDRLFGTFKAEEERPIYGITKNITSHNVIVVNFWEWRNMIRDAWYAPDWRTWAGYIFRKPGWQPNQSPKETPPPNLGEVPVSA
jgi:sterol desaturase/sphingolipid hydroxylase (fatty acid hydroxylase superfamily)